MQVTGINRVAPIGEDDVVDLRAASADEQAAGSADAYVRAYNAGFRDAEVWSTVASVWTQAYTDLLTPNANLSTGYQMSWVQSTLDAPNDNTHAEGVWAHMEDGDFEVGWSENVAGADRTGSVTVRIRFWGGPILDTAEWDGSAIVEEEGV